MTMATDDLTRRDLSKRDRQDLLADQQGLSTVEYIIILVLIAVIAITAWKQFGEAVEYHVRDSTTQVNNLGL
ncbi:MAG: hypothetical protein H6721_14700 [Sandaracinus sp.]|nr:hypothetical protein [Sandaracinus sp.]